MCNQAAELESERDNYYNKAERLEEERDELRIEIKELNKQIQ